MRTLMCLDEKNYTDDMPLFLKYAVRAVIIRDGRIAMQKAKAGYYKILGGGVDEGEAYEDALVREVQEEAGLVVRRDSIREIGEIVEIRQDLFEKDHKYECHSIFYFCDVEDDMVETKLTASEVREGFDLEWATPEAIIDAYDKMSKVSERVDNKPWVDRDTCFIKMLQSGEIKCYTK